MIVIDGSFGEGGGQIVRSSLSLSAALGVPLRLEQVRARRPRPGLSAQHLSAARAAAKVTGGRLAGAGRGSLEFEFYPGDPCPGRYAVEIGTAGSVTLVFQTLLPILSSAGAESVVTIHGGTHNPMAPPAEYISECFLPALLPLGLSAECELIRPGFYPRGGGALRGRVLPWQTPSFPLSLLDDVDWGDPEPSIIISNLPDHVAEREKMTLAESLRLDPEKVLIHVLPGELGPGNAVQIRHRGQDRVALITAFGEPGKKAERVAREAARESRQFARSRAPVEPRLADQLLLPMALGAGGAFITSAVTEHARTQAEVLRRFLGVEVKMEMLAPDRFKLEVPGAGRFPR